jgi:hypothetical protein
MTAASHAADVAAPNVRVLLYCREQRGRARRQEKNSHNLPCTHQAPTPAKLHTPPCTTTIGARTHTLRGLRRHVHHSTVVQVRVSSTHTHTHTHTLRRWSSASTQPGVVWHGAPGCVPTRAPRAAGMVTPVSHSHGRTLAVPARAQRQAKAAKGRRAGRLPAPNTTQHPRERARQQKGRQRCSCLRPQKLRSRAAGCKNTTLHDTTNTLQRGQRGLRRGHSPRHAPPATPLWRPLRRSRQRCTRHAHLTTHHAARRAHPCSPPVARACTRTWQRCAR